LPDGYTLDTGYGAKVTVKAPLSSPPMAICWSPSTRNGRSVMTRCCLAATNLRESGIMSG
jgi:hypothetical protein